MTYKWMPEFSDQFRKDVNALSSKDRMIVFRKMAQLLEANDPIDMQEVTDIKPLSDPKYMGAWRKRAGNNRIIYRTVPSAIIESQREYNGRLIFEAVVFRRDL